MDVLNIEKNAVSTVHTFLKFCNVINAALLICAGVVAFVNLTTFSLAYIFMGAYLVCFGCLLGCFELHLKRFDRYVFLNFGFMYYWKWRSLFFCFVGSMSFGLGILGMIAGAMTVVNVIFNAWVMARHSGYKQFLLDQNEIHLTQARSAEAAKFDNDGGVAAGFGQATHFLGVATGAEQASFDDVRQGAQFYKENKQTVCGTTV
jgi:hypothetical protein